MGNLYFTATVKYDKTMDDGVVKSVTEQYIVSALNVQEANSIVIESMSPYISGKFDVDGIKKIKLESVIESNDNLADTWYMVKIGFMTLDEKTGAEKIVASRSLVCSDTLTNAIAMFSDYMKNIMGEWKYISVSETKYMDYFVPQPAE